jgi:ribonuclease G
MSEEILINVTPPETRVAIVENGVVQEVIIERTHQLGLIGNIYKGVDRIGHINLVPGWNGNFGC